MFDKVIGYQDEKVELARILDTILNESQYTAIGVKTPRNILLHGDAGIGKSLLAGEFAKATKKKIYVIRKDKPDGDFVNFIKETFKDAAEFFAGEVKFFCIIHRFSPYLLCFLV